MLLLPLHLHVAMRGRLADLPIFDLENKNSFQAAMETDQALVETNSRSENSSKSGRKSRWPGRVSEALQARRTDSLLRPCFTTKDFCAVVVMPICAAICSSGSDESFARRTDFNGANLGELSRPKRLPSTLSRRMPHVCC
jgi:hypothetical protein